MNYQYQPEWELGKIFVAKDSKDVIANYQKVLFKKGVFTVDQIEAIIEKHLQKMQAANNQRN